MESTIRRRLGVLTIGQAPRDDAVPPLRPLFGDVDIVERGALDGLSREDVAAFGPVSAAAGSDPGDTTGTPTAGAEPAGDVPLVTRLADGSEVIVGKRALLPRLQEAIGALEREGTDAILLICTGAFPRFDHAVPLLLADQLLLGGVTAITGDARVGVLCPLPSQQPLTHEKWEPSVGPVEVASASPYGDRAPVVDAAEKLADSDVEFVVLDCIGYDENHRRAVRDACGRPVLLARSVVARLAGEVVA